MNLEIEFGNRKLSFLLYAVDTDFVVNSPEDLQPKKNRTKETSFIFTIGSNKLEKIDNYKYVGVKFTRTGNFTLNAEHLGKAGGGVGSPLENYINYS